MKNKPKSIESRKTNIHVLKLGSPYYEYTKVVQIKLNQVLGLRLSIDGLYENMTRQAVIDFQKKNKLEVDGVFGRKSREKLDSLFKIFNPKFVVFVDAGHGGVELSELRYQTLGKRWKHSNLRLHFGAEWYYEGYENRLVAEEFIRLCNENGIETIRIYDAVKDTSLSSRSFIVKNYLDMGYYGYLHSFHSDAAPEYYTTEVLERIKGFSVYTTIGNNLSDKIAELHYKNTELFFKNDIRYRTDKSDGDKDFEKNLKILKDTNVNKYQNFGAILEEWGFHTSRSDVQKIIMNRHRRALVALKTAINVKKDIFKL